MGIGARRGQAFGPTPIRLECLPPGSWNSNEVIVAYWFITMWILMVEKDLLGTKKQWSALGLLFAVIYFLFSNINPESSIYILFKGFPYGVGCCGLMSKICDLRNCVLSLMLQIEFNWSVKYICKDCKTITHNSGSILWALAWSMWKPLMSWGNFLARNNPTMVLRLGEW